MAQGKVKELIEKYEEIRARKERLAKEKTAAEEEYKQIQIDLAEAITEIGEDSATNDGFVYSPKVQGKYSFRAQEDLEAEGLDKIEILKENGFGEIVKETVDWRTLNSTMREVAESDEGIPDEVREILNVYDEIVVSRTKKASDKQDKLKEAFRRRGKNV